MEFPNRWAPSARLVATGIVAALGAVGGTDASAQSYPLHCQAGRDMRLSVGVTGGRNTAKVFFRPSAAPASAGVPPGHCAWSDRGWREGEPTNLQVRDVGRVVGTFRNGTYSGLEFSRGDLRFLERITRDNGGVFIFQVHREGTGGNGTMVVDRVGP